jgi:hypothetical protein
MARRPREALKGREFSEFDDGCRLDDATDANLGLIDIIFSGRMHPAERVLPVKSWDTVFEFRDCLMH